MVTLAVDEGPFRTTAAKAEAGGVPGARGAGTRSRTSPASARRVLRRLAVFIAVPAAYVAVAALGRNLGLAGAPAAAYDSVPGKMGREPQVGCTAFPPFATSVDEVSDRTLDRQAKWPQG